MKTTHEMLVTARYWMGQLHGVYWNHPETLRNGPAMKQLIRDIKAVDRVLKREAIEASKRIAKVLRKSPQP